MINIIKSFRIAASAKGGAPETISPDDRVSKRTEGDKDFIAVSAIDDVKRLLGDTPLAFGYPDMCSFEIIMVKESSEISTDTNDGDILTQIFESEFCVIENVQIDYGSQNKMLFFDKDETDGKYYPAEVTLTIGLKETTLALAQQITQEQNANYADKKANTRTIF